MTIAKRNRKFIVLLASMLLPGCLLRAQQTPGHAEEISKIVRLNRAPVSKEILQVTLPKTYTIKLPNGLQIQVIEQHKLPTVTFELWIKAGALDDPKSMPGLASFTADMLTEGTTRRSSAQLATDVDSLGASLTASAQFGASYSTVDASGFSPDSNRILDLMSDVVLNATFPQDELAKYKRRQLADLEQERSLPFFLAREKFEQVLYGGFPASVAAPTEDSIKTVTTADLRRFYDEYYAPNNAILGVVGDVTESQIIALIARHFGSWKPRPAPKPDLPPLAPAPESKVYLIDRPGSVQAALIAGTLAVKRASPDYIPLFVMNRIVGGGPQARLFVNLRAEHGYTYGAYSSLSADTYPGAWAASTQVHNSVTDGSMTQLMFEFKRIRDQRVGAEELGEAERSIVASFALSLEQPSQLLDRAMTVTYFGLPADYWQRFPAEVAKVTAAQVQAMARKYVDLGHLQIVCVADANQPGNSQKQSIRDVLKKYGEVDAFDANGKKEE